MSYNSDFQIDFINRSLDLLKKYSGPHDATHLMNCLLGLVIVPNNRCFDKKIKISCPIDDISSWGIPQNQKKNQTKKFDVADFIRRLRNSIGHARFCPEPKAGDVTAFTFHNEDKTLLTTMSLGQLRCFAVRLAEHLNTL